MLKYHWKEVILMVTTGLIVGLIYYILSIFLHLLIIGKVISYNDVNGGRSSSYEAQRKTSIFSIVILLTGIMYLISNLLFSDFSDSILNHIIIGILSFYWLIGFFMQLMGTKFERYYLSWLVIIGVISHILVFVGLF